MANSPQVSTDPFASIAQPISQPPQSAQAVSVDPFASITQPLSDKGTLAKVGEFAKGVGEGAVTSMGETIQALPWVGKKIISPEDMQAEREYFKPGSAAEKYGQTTGDIAEPIIEFVLGDEALKGLAISKKIGIASKIAQIAQDSPYIGKLLQHGVNVARTGTVGTAEALAKGATLPQALQTGAAVGIGGEALSAAVEAAPSVVKSAAGLRNPFRAKLVQQAMASPEAIGEAAAQPVARAGVEAAAPTVGPSLRSGIDIKTPFAAAKSLYRTVDDAAKTNFQDLYTKLDNAEDAARQAAVGSPEEAKAQLGVKTTQDHIDDMKAVAAKSGVTDVDKMLAQADAKYAETQANKDFNSKFFGSQSIIEGNVAHGVPERINVDPAIQALENMDKPNKYGISRLQQTSLGKDGAFKLKQYLYDAQKAGQKALDARALRNTILKWGIPGITGALGLGYELTK